MINGQLYVKRNGDSISGAIDVSVTNLLDGIDTAQFAVPNPSRNLLTTWEGYIEDDITIWVYRSAGTDPLIFEGYIESVISREDKIVVNCNDEKAKYRNVIAGSSTGDFSTIEAEGKISVVNNTILTCTDEEGNAFSWTTDEFEDYYVIVDDTSANEYSIALENHDGGDQGYVGYDGTSINHDSENNDYTEVEFEPDGTPWAMQTICNDTTLSYMSIHLEVENANNGLNRIALTSNVTRVRVQFIGYLNLYHGDGTVSAGKQLEVKILMHPDNDGGAGGTYLVIENAKRYFLEANGTNNEFDIVIDQEFIVDATSDIFKNNEGTYWEQGFFTMVFQNFDAEDSGIDTQVIIAMRALQITVYYNTATHSQLNELITDNTSTSILSATNFSTEGVSANDTFTVAIPAATILDRLRIGNPSANMPSLPILLDTTIEKGVAMRYKGATTYDVMLAFCEQFTLHQFTDYNGNQNSVHLAKYADMTEVATAVSGFTQAYQLETPNNKYGHIMVIWKDSMVQKEVDASIKKIHTVFRKDILTQSVAEQLAEDLATEFATFQRAFQLDFEGWNEQLYRVGYLYDVTLEGESYTNLVCRRVSYTQDGSNGMLIRNIFLGGGHTPPDEWHAYMFGTILREMKNTKSTDASTTYSAIRWHNQLNGIGSSDHHAPVTVTDATSCVTLSTQAITVNVKDEDTMASDSATHLATQQSIKAYVDTMQACGSANKRWAPLLPAGELAATLDWNIKANKIDNQSTSGPIYFAWDLGLPLIVNGLHLYIDAVRIGVVDADANNYVDVLVMYYLDKNGGALKLNDGTNRTSADEYTYTLTAASTENYRGVRVQITAQIDTANALDISTVEVEYYYA